MLFRGQSISVKSGREPTALPFLGAVGHCWGAGLLGASWVRVQAAA